MAEPLSITLNSSAQTASGSGSAVDLGSRRSLLALQVTVTAGDASFDLEIESSPDGSTGWHTLRNVRIGFEPGDVGAVDMVIDRSERYVRASWVLVSGTTLTFTVAGEAHTIYATRSDVFGTQVPAAAFEDMDGSEPDVVPKALLGATSDCEDALNVRYPLPLETWPMSLRERASAIASYRIMCHRGFAPEGTDELIVKRYDDAMKWLRDVSQGRITPAGLTPGSIPAVTAVSGNVDMPDPPRRFQDDWGDFG